MITKKCKKHLLAAAIVMASNIVVANQNSYLQSANGKPVLDGSGECIQVNNGVSFPTCEPTIADLQITNPVRKPEPIIPEEFQLDKLFYSGLPLFEVTNFAFDSDELTQESKKAIDQFISKLSNPEIERVTIIGHADSTGSTEYNLSLSERRANAVEMYLEQKGIYSTNIENFGVGESVPIASNATEEGRSENRRVEITVIPSEQIASR